MNPNQSIPENSVTPPIQAQVTPDLVSPQGKQAVQQQLAGAITDKGKLDFIFKGIAQKVGSEFTSRVKNPETVIQKVATKRMAGRDYNLDDVNDNYGARIIIKNEKQIPEIMKLVKKANDLGIFTINKKEKVNMDYHKAQHVDFETDSGTKGELQILTAQEEANSNVNHDLRSTLGENLKGVAKDLADKQAKMTKSLSYNKAHQLASTISDAHKSSNEKPLPAQVNATLLAQAKQ